MFLLGGAIAFSVLEILSGVMPTFALTALLLVPTGLVMLTYSTASNASVQLSVEPTMRGRVMSIYLLAFMGGTPFGAPLIGWLAEVSGPRWGLLGGGLVCLICTVTISVLISRKRGLTPSYLSGRLSRAWH
jgi:MFS family permease